MIHFSKVHSSICLLIFSFIILSITHSRTDVNLTAILFPLSPLDLFLKIMITLAFFQSTEIEADVKERLHIFVKRLIFSYVSSFRVLE